MAEKKTKYIFISKGSDLYSQASELRYETFFMEFNLDKNIVFDRVEERSIHLSAVKNNTLIGYVRLTYEEHGALISQMAVSQNHRYSGTGRHLIEKIVEKAFNEGYRYIYLWSRMEAVGFYEKCGFTQGGEESISEKTGLPHILMIKIFEDY